ncbi:hypothetical protein LPJ70_006803, partial [Coemansia sp. RSA 2708]
ALPVRARQRAAVAGPDRRGVAGELRVHHRHGARPGLCPAPAAQEVADWPPLHIHAGRRPAAVQPAQVLFPARAGRRHRRAPGRAHAGDRRAARRRPVAVGLVDGRLDHRGPGRRESAADGRHLRPGIPANGRPHGPPAQRVRVLGALGVLGPLGAPAPAVAVLLQLGPPAPRVAEPAALAGAARRGAGERVPACARERVRGACPCVPRGVGARRAAGGARQRGVADAEHRAHAVAFAQQRGVRAHHAERGNARPLGPGAGAAGSAVGCGCGCWISAAPDRNTGAPATARRQQRQVTERAAAAAGPDHVVSLAARNLAARAPAKVAVQQRQRGGAGRPPGRRRNGVADSTRGRQCAPRVAGELAAAAGPRQGAVGAERAGQPVQAQDSVANQHPPREAAEPSGQPAGARGALVGCRQRR